MKSDAEKLHQIGRFSLQQVSVRPGTGDAGAGTRLLGVSSFHLTDEVAGPRNHNSPRGILGSSDEEAAEDGESSSRPQKRTLVSRRANSLDTRSFVKDCGLERRLRNNRRLQSRRP